MNGTVKKALSAILTVIMIVSCSAVVFASEKQEITGSNWMSALADSKSITAINMPGTHDSATQNIRLASLARTQSLSVTQQLNAGVRYLDIRLEKKGDDYISVHGIISNKKDYGMFSENLKADEIIADCEEFLANNPGETILMFIKEDNGNAGASFYTQFYNNFVKGNDIWYIENRVPTLGEVRGKIVLLRYNEIDETIFDETNSGINFSKYPYIPEKDTINFKSKNITSIDGAKHIATMFVEDSYNLSADEKWTAIKTFFDSELNDSDFNICVTSSDDKFLPVYNAQIINNKLMNYEFTPGKTYGIISVDFASAELCEKIYMTNEPDMTQPPLESAAYNDERTFSFLGKLFEAINYVVTKIIISWAAI